MKKIIYLLVIMVSTFSCKEAPVKENKTVFIKGTVANYLQDTLYMNNVTAKNMLFKEDIHSIPLTEKTDFKYTFELDKPAYFLINSTFLYLSPGDSLVVSMDSATKVRGKRDNSNFTGKGAEANNYLTKVPYPKAGSYWENKEVVSKIKIHQDMPKAFKEATNMRLEELNALTNVSEGFKRLEKARIKFDYVNTLQSVIYLYIYKLSKGEMTREDIASKMEIAKDYFVPFVKENLNDFNSTDYLQLESYQSVLYSLKEENFRAKHSLPELSSELKEYVLTSKLISGFSNEGVTADFIKIVNDGLGTIKNQDYKTAINYELNAYKSIIPGEPASDLTFTKLDGSTVKLSAYKGKVIVLDLWATWCSPCMYEKPFFEALEEKFYGNENVELISLSIDTEKVWKKYFEKNPVIGNQLQIYRSELSDYKVTGIPRFFVIGKDFNIINVFAPRPSSGELEALINKHI